MKREEATDVFRMIASVYDIHPERAAELAPVWVRALEELDANDVMDVVSGWLKGSGPEKIPTVVAFVQEIRIAEQRRRKAASYDPDAAPDCAVCLDNGWVIIGSSMIKAGEKMVEGSEIWVACPSCDVGRGIEFPLEAVGPWGPDGYWRGRQWQHAGHVTVELTS